MVRHYALYAEGTELELLPANGIHGVRVAGGGMPPVQNVLSRYALMDGAYHQRTAIRERVVTISLMLNALTLPDLALARRQLVELVRKPDLELRYYYDDEDYVLLRCVYDGGLDGSEQATYYERVGLRLLAVDPYWYAPDEVMLELATMEVVAGIGNVLHIAADGVVDTMDGGVADPASPASDEVAKLARSGGHVLAFGAFTEAGSTPESVNGIAEWGWNSTDGWHWMPNEVPWDMIADYDSGGTAVVGIRVASAFYVYGWCYIDDGGGPVVRHTLWKYTMAGWTETLSSVISDLAAGPDGLVWGASEGVGGTQIIYLLPDGSETRVTAWDNSEYYLCVGVSPTDGMVYAGGNFTVIAPNGGAPVSALNMACYDPNTSIWTPMGDGLAGPVSRIVVGGNGIVYAASLEPGVPAVSKVWAWNGTIWTKLGGDIGDLGVVDMQWTERGLMVCDGASIRYWQENRWADAGLGGPWGSGVIKTVSFRELALYPDADDDVYVGGMGLDAWVGPGVTTVTNAGTAKAFPLIVAGSSGGDAVLARIVNYTTGQSLELGTMIPNADVVEIDTHPGRQRMESMLSGNLLHTLWSGSLADFWLEPGENRIGVLATGSGVTMAGLSYTPRYLSSDMG